MSKQQSYLTKMMETFTSKVTNKQWTSKEKHHAVETFIEAFKNELQKEEHIKKKLSKNNLTQNEIEA